MSFLSWNCRGTGGSLCSSKMLHLSRLIVSTNAQVQQQPDFNAIQDAQTHLPDLQHQHINIPDKEEIWNILKNMKRDAAPGPDGFNVAFYRAAWQWIGDDVTTLVRNFYTSGISLGPGCPPIHSLLFADDLIICGVQEEDSSKSFHFRSWDDICRPKHEGGLGIRKLQDVNKSLVLHSAWLIASDKDSFLVKNLLHENSIMQISNGNSNIWNEPWCEGFFPGISEKLNPFFASQQLNES
ncbi:unnamed protein product [Urochloa humidicola]